MPTAAEAFWAGGGSSEGKKGPWAVLRINDKVFPGVSSEDDPGACVVQLQGGVRYRIDSQKVKGKSGHRLVSEAYEPTVVHAMVRVYNAAQWAAYRAYFPTINPKLKTNYRKAYRASHPYLDLYSISSVYINEATFPTEADGRMVREVRLSLMEVFDLRNDGAKAVKPTDPAASLNIIKPFQNVDGQVDVEPRRP